MVVAGLCACRTESRRHRGLRPPTRAFRKASSLPLLHHSAVDNYGVEAGVVDSGFEKLPISFKHAEAAAAWPPHHSDPFDRMLVVQAQCENLALVTHDRHLQPYGVQILWA